MQRLGQIFLSLFLPERLKSDQADVNAVALGLSVSHMTAEQWCSATKWELRFVDIFSYCYRDSGRVKL